jgi:nicotinate (nicotinamide) nucleotide adenylyltransferase
MQRLGVLGGTFDPIHVGHLIAASEALYRYGLDSVLFVPAGQPWQKSSYSEAEDRFLMTVLGTSGHRAFQVSRLELDRKGPTYTADTMEALILLRRRARAVLHRGGRRRAQARDLGQAAQARRARRDHRRDATRLRPF